MKWIKGREGGNYCYLDIKFAGMITGEYFVDWSKFLLSKLVWFIFLKIHLPSLFSKKKKNCFFLILFLGISVTGFPHKIKSYIILYRIGVNKRFNFTIIVVQKLEMFFLSLKKYFHETTNGPIVQKENFHSIRKHNNLVRNFWINFH